MFRARFFAAAALSTAAAVCQSLPMASRPEDVGISSARLERIRTQMKADVAAGRLPHAVLLIARKGKIASLDAFAPAKTDTIFRIASMTKPVVSVAAMILAE